MLAPDIPNLSYNLTGLELALERVRLRDGRVEKAAGESWKSLVAPRHSFGRQELIASVQLDTGLEYAAEDVAVLDGKLTLRLPQQVSVVTLADTEPGTSVSGAGVTLRVRELARDWLVSVEAYTADGEALAIEDAELARVGSATELRCSVHGRPARVDVQLSRASSRFEYAFALRLPGPVPSAAQP